MHARLAAIAHMIGLVVCGLLLDARGSVRADARPEWVIAPGQEAVIGRMLGGARGIVGCTYQTADVRRTDVMVRLSCPNAPLAVLLTHPPRGACTGLCSEKFHIEITGDAPDGFAASLLASIRREERAFAWTAPVGSRPTASEDWFDPRALAANGLVIAVVVLVLVRTMMRRRREAS